MFKKAFVVFTVLLVFGLVFAKANHDGMKGDDWLKAYPWTWGDHDINPAKLIFTISDAGCFGFAISDADSEGRFTRIHGFQWNNYASSLYTGSVWIGKDFTHVSDASYGTVPYEFRYDFVPVDTLTWTATRSDEDSKCSYNDDDATNPLGILIQQNGLAWNTQAAEDYVILEYIVTPKSDTDTLKDLYISVYCDWDIGDVQSHYGDSTGFDSTSNMMWQATDDPAWATNHFGTALLTHTATGYWGVTNRDEVYDTMLTDSLKFYMATHKKAKCDTVYDSGTVISFGPFNCSKAEPFTAAFALIGGADLDDLIANALNAKARYEGTGFSGNRKGVPARFDPFINVTPNPVRNFGTYTYRTNENGKVKISLYDLSGKKVTTIAEKTLNKGVYHGAFNTSSYKTGIYFVRLETPTKSVTKKIAIVR